MVLAAQLTQREAEVLEGLVEGHANKVIAFELGARALIASSLRRWLTRPMTWVDTAILATLLFPATFSNCFVAGGVNK